MNNQVVAPHFEDYSLAFTAGKSRPDVLILRGAHLVDLLADVCRSGTVAPMTSTFLPNMGTLIIGAKAANLRRAADLVEADEQVVVVDADALDPDALVEITMRARALNRSLVVVATATNSIPRQARDNLATHLLS